jgi:DNA-binding response OmpR family regulator
MLTAKDDVSDKVTGLDVGADDYMTKPFAIEELLARIRVLLKRKIRNDLNEVINENKDILKHERLKLYKDNYRVEYGDDEIELTKKEFQLLEYLMINKNIVLSREKILENVWGYDYFGETNLIDVYIRYLRGKIDQKYDVDIIKTVRGVGYIIRD